MRHNKEKEEDMNKSAFSESLRKDFARKVTCIKFWFLYLLASYYRGKGRAQFYYKHGMIKKELLPDYVNARPVHKRVDWLYRSRTYNFWSSAKAHTYEGRERP